MKILDYFRATMILVTNLRLNYFVLMEILFFQILPNFTKFTQNRCRDIFMTFEIFYRDALRMGYIKPWTEVAESLTGYSKISSEPLLEYFQPLYEYLKKENERAEKEERGHPVHILKRIDHTFVVVISVIVILIITFVVVYFAYLRNGRVPCLHLFFQ